MFSELPKLLERNFAIGYFLPVSFFVSITIYFLSANPTIFILKIIQEDILIGTTIIGLYAWLLSIFLLVTNRDLFRILEGYGDMNPAKVMKWWQVFRFRSLKKKLEKLDQEYLTTINDKKKFSPEKLSARNRILRKLSECYPDDERWLLPTSFGNVVRSFEVYPRVMYGFEAVDGWSRILSVIPEEYRILIDNAKSHVDFWVNLWALFLVLALEYIIIIFMFNHPINWMIILSLLLIAIFASYRASREAVEWGDMVKSAIDIYRFDLLEKLGFSIPKTRKKEREIWSKFSQSIIYRLPDSLPQINKTFKKQ